MIEPSRTPHRRAAAPSIFALWVLVSATGCALPGTGVEAGGERINQPGPPLRADAPAPAGEDPSTTEPQSDGGTKAEPAAEVRLSRVSLRREANRVLDDWHAAAAVGARDRYIRHFSPDAIFLGTDATERWDLATFTNYVDEHFAPGKGWAYTPSNRYVMLGPDDKVAWFDEALDSDGYGALRGTGVLRRDGDTWRIAHYSMTFTIPNGVARDVVDVVRAAPPE